MFYASKIYKALLALPILATASLTIPSGASRRGTAMAIKRRQCRPLNHMPTGAPHQQVHHGDKKPGGFGGGTTMMMMMTMTIAKSS